MELNGPFTSVTGTFSVPSLLPNDSSSELMAEWVGIDGGDGGDSLIQAGINETPVPGNPDAFVIQPWWEILPQAETYITGVAVHPGDRVTVTIDQLSGTRWRITLTDDTDGGSFTIDRGYAGPADTAEWVLEALTVGGNVAALAPFSPAATFSDLGFTGPDVDLEEVVMVQGANQVSTPSALTANGFSVAYGSNAPPSPSSRSPQRGRQSFFFPRIGSSSSHTWGTGPAQLGGRWPARPLARRIRAFRGTSRSSPQNLPCQLLFSASPLVSPRDFTES